MKSKQKELQIFAAFNDVPDTDPLTEPSLENQLQVASLSLLELSNLSMRLHVVIDFGYSHIVI